MAAPHTQPPYITRLDKALMPWFNAETLLYISLFMSPPYYPVMDYLEMELQYKYLILTY